jgi:dTDP-4-amino-4,6-dideoxygalactose transaminase
MEAIEQLAVAYGFTVLEDASHAIGGHYQQGKIGSCERSALTVFSFHPVKIVTTGEGGMVLTNNPVLYKKLLLLRSHGITRNREEMQTVLEPGESPAPWVYQQIALGYNYRMTDIQAALGFSQMQRIDEFITRRHGLANRYNTQLQHLPVVLPWQHPETYSSFHLYIIRLKTADITVTHRQVFEALREKGIGVNLHYIPVHTQPHYQNLGFQAGDFPEAEAYYQQAISLPLYYDLKEEEQDFIIEGLRDVLLRGKA